VKRLKPCPWCGGEACVEEVDGAIPGHIRKSVGCSTENCFGYQSFVSFETIAEAIAAWNSRAKGK
jgi:hypothetical protein